MCKAYHVDEKQGVIITDNINIQDNTIIYDIKPYIPCEDRVLQNNHQQRKDSERIHHFVYQNELTLEDLPEQIVIESKGIFKHLNGKGTLIMNEKVNQELNQSIFARVFWWFNQFEDKRYRNTLVCNPPYEKAPKTGIFAARSPVRLNPIASTVVKITDITHNQITIECFDGFDNSVILDIIPYEGEKETVVNATVPKWLTHWEDHKSFRKEKAIDHELSLQLSDTDRFIQKYFDQKEKHPSKISHDEEKTTDYEHITVKNAWKNNLKNIHVTIPKNQITVITGVSGSGKSTLAFDTIYAESSRQFLSIMNNDNSIQKPEVDEITGLQPAVGIGQKTPPMNPRSTVGTFSGIAELLRSLFTTIGVRHCEHCHHPVEVLSEGATIHLLKTIMKESPILLRPHGLTERIDLNNQVEIQIKKALKTGNGAVIATIE